MGTNDHGHSAESMFNEDCPGESPQQVYRLTNHVTLASLPMLYKVERNLVTSHTACSPKGTFETRSPPP